MKKLMPILFLAATGPCFAAGVPAQKLAARPPMLWSNWAHYQCNYTAETTLANARALVQTGLAKRGYNMVSIDECWMQKTRDNHGNLQANPKRFPHGIKPVADAIHAMGLKLGIYEDAGSETCAGYAGSGQPRGGGKAYFLRDTKLFASWGVDYLMLDGCNLYVPPGETRVEAYRNAYRAESEAIRKVGRPMILSESAPAYFMGGPEWYDVLTWVRHYGQLWREGSDVANYDASNPDRPRFQSVVWNYSYNLPLGRFQKPGNWDDADYIIGGDSGMTLAETRSQMALWSMMSAPLKLSVDLEKLSPQAIAVLGNKAVIAVDQDPLGRMANLLRRTPETDVLFKTLSGENDAVAVFNHSSASRNVQLSPGELGFRSDGDCRLDARNLWNGSEQRAASMLNAKIAPHDTAIWSIHPAASCGKPARMGAITTIAAQKYRIAFWNGRHPSVSGYMQCLTSNGVETCSGRDAETWTVTSTGALESSGGCLDAGNGKLEMKPCSNRNSQQWRYTLVGNLIADQGKCLTATASDGLSLQACGHNLRSQIWSLPN